MPGWHKAAKKWIDKKRIVIVGVIQEQHPERCELFAQWQKFDWPILHDPINLLGNSAVPVTIAIDEYGVVRSTRPNPRTFEKEFLNLKFDKPTNNANSIGVRTNWKLLLKTAETKPNSITQKNAGDAILLWGGIKNIGKAIQLYSAASKSNENDPSLLFRLGVAHQIRNESVERFDQDFSDAVKYWQSALSKDPNQYIWRRRIQQYGPRLDKPYPFYDWVAQARKEITARGETPIKLPIEPTGAEFATKSKSLPRTESEVNPDPDGKIARDSSTVIKIKSTVVPHTYKPKSSAMVHVEFTPNDNVTWSNEAGPLEVWIDGDEIQQSRKRFSLINKDAVESSEKRKLEFEIARQKVTTQDTLLGYALYYVCEKEGQCKFLRQDFEIKFLK